jgi:hypothetical protein
MSSAALASGRARAESRMTSRARVRRVDPDNPTTVDGIETDGWADVYADLPMRLGGSDRGGAGTRSVTIGETEVQVAVRVAHFPADTTGLRDGDVVEVTEGENAGVFARIVEAGWQDQATARRVPVVETQRPEGWSA